MNYVYYVDMNKGSLLCLRFTYISKLRTGIGGEWMSSPVKAFREVILSHGFSLNFSYLLYLTLQKIK